MAKSKPKPIFIPGTNMQFPSVTAAAKTLGINAGNIYSVLGGRRKTAGGYQFGYAANRVVHIPETGKSFHTIQDAAKSVNVRPKKAVKGLEGRSNSAIGGYHFIYADASKVGLPGGGSSSDVPPPTKAKKKNRTATKKSHIQARRAKKQEKFERVQQKAKRNALDREVQRERRKYDEKVKEFQKLIRSVNKQLDKYYALHPNYIHYNASTPEIFAYMQQLGNAEHTHFDVNSPTFRLTTGEEIQKQIRDLTELETAFKIALESHKNSFWDIDRATRERAELTIEFQLPHEGYMDPYADLIWEILDVIRRSNQYEELGSDRVYRAVRDAMNEQVDPYSMIAFLQDLELWMDTWPNVTVAELDDIFDILNSSGGGGNGAAAWDDFWGSGPWTI